MKIRVNLDDLAILLDLPNGMRIRSAGSDDMVLVCEVEAPDSQDGEFFAQYEIDESGIVLLTELSPI